MQHPILAFYTCTEHTSDKAVERHSQFEGAHCQLRGRKQSPPSCWGCCWDPIWAALQLLALLLHAGAGTVGSSSWHLCVPTLVLLLGAAQHLQRAQTPPPALSNPPGGLLELLKVFLPPFHFVSPVSGNDRVESELLMFCFSAVAFLNVTGDNPNSRSTELPQQQLCGNVGTFHQELFLHWQSLPAIRNKRSESWAILDVCYHLPIYLDLFFLSGKKKPKNKLTLNRCTFKKNAWQFREWRYSQRLTHIIKSWLSGHSTGWFFSFLYFYSVIG